LWRRDHVGRPVAATESRLITLDSEGSEFLLRVLAAEDGHETGVARSLGMPVWAAQIGTAEPAVHVNAAESGDAIRIEWRVRRPYQGGAPPSSEIAAASRSETAGAIVLDPATARVQAAPLLAARGVADAISQEAESHVSADPEIVALDRIGDRTYAVRVRSVGGSSRVILEASRAGQGTPLWEETLAERKPEGPGPLRK
jgi:hypothetical protein